MSANYERSDVDTSRESAKDSAVSLTTSVDGFIRSIDASSDSDVVIELERGSDVIFRAVTSDLSKGDIDNPVSQVGASVDVTLRVSDSLSSSHYTLNLVVDEYRA